MVPNNTKNFDVLATIRYDPQFTHKFPLQGHSLDAMLNFSDIDEKLKLDRYDDGYNFTNDLNLHDDNFSYFRQKFSEVNSLYNNDQVRSPFETNSLYKSVEKIAASVNDLLSLRFLCLQQHVKRIKIACQYFELNQEITYDSLLKLLIDELKKRVDQTLSYEQQLIDVIKDPTALKIRILTNKERIEIETYELPSTISSISTSDYFIKTILSGLLNSSSNVWDAFIDEKATDTCTPFTTFKTTNRILYNEARERMFKKVEKYRKSDTDEKKHEIILFNKKNEVVEGSITNIAVQEKDPITGNVTWKTPYLSSGCLCGIMRYYLLSKGLVTEGEVRTDDLEAGSTILIFNGVMGCVKAVIRL